MLIPSKHAHPDDTVLAAATQLLPALRRAHVMQYDELKKRLPDREGADYLFTPAVDLLFLLGLLEYHPNVDAFVYTGS